MLCVDDHPIVLNGVCMTVNHEPDMEVVAAAATGEEAVAAFQLHRPDVTLMDLQLPKMTGLEAIRAIRDLDRDARIVVLTIHRGDYDLVDAKGAGASAYLTKDTVCDSLIDVIRTVCSSNRPLVTKSTAQPVGEASRERLTSREVEVLQLISQGLRDKEVGVALGISENTVHVHVKHVLRKLDVQDRTAAVSAAFNRGILHVR